MAVRHFANYLLPIPQAARLASLGGISADLEGVIAYCNYLDQTSEFEKLNFIVWEAMSSAAVVRYARCFGKGVREPLPQDFFASAPLQLQQSHEYFMAVRSKQVAHSVNDFEENDVVAQIDASFQSSAEIEHIHSTHSRVLGLGFGDTARLTALSQWASARVEALIEAEKQLLLPVVRTIPLAKIKRFGQAELGRGGNRENATRRRPRA